MKKFLMIDILCGKKIEKFNFFQIPKALMNEKYDGVRVEAKVLYSLLLERTKLSKKNKKKSQFFTFFSFFTLF